MCRSGDVFRQCSCGADIKCAYEWSCQECAISFYDQEDD